MYRWLREIHLALGVFSFGFLVLYGVSAVQMAHFNVPVRASEARVALSGAAGGDARAVARELMERGLVRGVLREVEAGEASLRFRLERLGTVHSVTYFHDRGEALVHTRDSGLLGVLNRLHHTAGFWHESPALKAWGVFVAITSAALILLAATGIYLWSRLRNERRVGAFLLAAGLMYSLTLVWLIRTA